MEEIKVGDVVSLKSDEHAQFTVGWYNAGENEAWVYWYDHTSKSLKNMSVPVAILKK